MFVFLGTQARFASFLISICGFRAWIPYRCIFNVLVISIHLCLFQRAAIKVSAKSCEFCLNSCWDFCASHLESLQRLAAGTAIYNVPFTVYELAELR